MNSLPSLNLRENLAFRSSLTVPFELLWDRARETSSDMPTTWLANFQQSVLDQLLFLVVQPSIALQLLCVFLTVCSPGRRRRGRREEVWVKGMLWSLNG